MPNPKKIFIEYGLDFDNNRYGFGRSTEIEYDDGSEMRTHEKIRINKIHARYFRIWIGKFMFVISSDKPYFDFKRKTRWSFKIVYGISGFLK
jgi:hypothetical protein